MKKKKKIESVGTTSPSPHNDRHSYSFIIINMKLTRIKKNIYMKRCQRDLILTSVEYLHPIFKRDKLGDKIPSYFNLSNTISFSL